MSFKKKMLMLLLAFLVLAACTTTIIQAPLLLELTQPVPLEKATARGAKHLFSLVQQERGWRSDLLSTQVLVLPTVQEKTTKVLEPSKQILPFLQQQASSFKGLNLITPDQLGTSKAHYELHSSIAMTQEQSKEKIILSMWMFEPTSKRTLSTVSSAIKLEPATNKPFLQQNNQAQAWLAALQEMSRFMTEAVYKDRSWRTQLNTTQVLLIPTYDANSKDNLTLTADVQGQLHKQANASLKLASISQKLLPQAHYIIHSALALDKLSAGQVYELNVWMRDAKTGRLVAHSKTKVLAQGLPYALSPESKDSPIYTAALNSNANGFDLRAEMQRPHYQERLKVEALLADAAQAYANAQYLKALEYYTNVSELKDGLSLRSLAGRYLCLLRLKRNAESRLALAELLRFGFKQGNQITFKILFAVDSTQFAGSDFLSAQYLIWTEEIASYLNYNQRCMLVAGHSSHSGSDEYNLKLSTARAKVIRHLMTKKQVNIQPRLQAIGKGFHENIIGTGTDDLRDAVDRRVEFRQQNCQ